MSCTGADRQRRYRERKRRQIADETAMGQCRPLPYRKMKVTGPRSAEWMEPDSPVDTPRVTTMDVSDYDAAPSGRSAKYTLKYLTECEHPLAYCAVVYAAPDSVIKSIANAAYNVEQGDVCLSPSEKALFRAHRDTITQLTAPTIGIDNKRELIASQGGVFPFLPILIGSALAAFGSRLFGGSTEPAQ